MASGSGSYSGKGSKLFNRREEGAAGSRAPSAAQQRRAYQANRAQFNRDNAAAPF